MSNKKRRIPTSLKKTRNKSHIEQNKTNEKVQTIAPLQLELIPLGLPRVKRKSNITPSVPGRMSLRSSAITIIKKATTPRIALYQKTRCSLGKFNVEGC